MRRVRTIWPLAFQLLSLAAAIIWCRFEYDTPRRTRQFEVPLASALNVESDLHEALSLLKPVEARLGQRQGPTQRTPLVRSANRPTIQTGQTGHLSAPILANYGLIDQAPLSKRRALERKVFQVRGQFFPNLPPNSGPIYVHVGVPEEEADGLMLSIGGGPLLPNGEFSVEAWAAFEPEVLRLSFSDERGIFHVRDVPAASTFIPAGALFECEVEEFSMQVFDDTRMPVEGARLRLFAESIGPGRSWTTGQTDSQGKASFLLPTGKIEYYLTKPGLHFAHGYVEWDCQARHTTEEIVLERLAVRDTIAGKTLDDNGMPVANALVKARPQTGLMTTTDDASTRSDELGRFSLRVAGNRSITLSAYTRELGLSGKVILRRGEDYAEIVFPAAVGPKHGVQQNRSQNP